MTLGPSAYWVPATAVFWASLLGSAHCVAMCGGLALSVSRTRASLWSYHIGRGLAYGLLGALAGALGEKVFPGRLGGWFSAGTLALLFLWMAWRSFRGGAEPMLISPTIRRSVERSLIRLMPRVGQDAGAALAVGVLSALLPCGWLHTFVLAAASTRSPWGGALLCMIFWSGTVPVLSVGMVGLRRFLAPIGREHRWIPGVLLLVAAFGALAIKVHPLIASPAHGEVPSCHHAKTYEPNR